MRMSTHSATTNPAGGLKIIESDAKSGESDPQWERFKGFVKNVAAVPKEEVDELRAERERKRRSE